MEQGFHVGGAVAVAVLVVRGGESLQIHLPASRAGGYGYRCVPVLTLTATIMELKVWTGFFWHWLAQGHRRALVQVWVHY
jgi:hypothetical protein